MASSPEATWHLVTPSITSTATMVPISDLVTFGPILRSRNTLNQKLRSDDSNLTVEHQEAINYFFGQWVPLENLLNRVTKRSSRSVSVFNINALKRLGVLDKECINQIAFLRKMRNSLIHDIEVPEASYIREQGEEAKVLLEKLTKLLETKTAEG